MDDNNQKKILTVPNVLSLIRLLLIPVYWVLFFKDIEMPYLNWHYRAVIVFLVASLTDLLDGKIARKYNLVTNVGKLLDPIADKLMTISVMLSLAMFINNTVYWVALALLLLKELCLLIGGAVLLKKKIVVYAKMIGKVAQCVILAALATSFFSQFFDQIGVPVHIIMICIATLISWSAGVFYAAETFKQLKTK